MLKNPAQKQIPIHNGMAILHHIRGLKNHEVSYQVIMNRKFYSIASGFLFFVSVFLMDAFCLAEVTSGGDESISIEVYPESNYASGDSVLVKYSVKNFSPFGISTASSYDGFGMRISILDPDQQRVTPYPYYPLSGGKFRILHLKPGETIKEQVNLGGFFPFHKVGYYDVTLTKRVYGKGEIPDKNVSDLKGEPIDIEAKSFRIYIDSPSEKMLRSMTSPFNGKTPGDQLDGINDLEWYTQKNSSIKIERENKSPPNYHFDDTYKLGEISSKFKMNNRVMVSQIGAIVSLIVLITLLIIFVKKKIGD